MHTLGDAGRRGRNALLPLTLTAIGVVYGDIGTSPLYTHPRVLLRLPLGAADAENVLGVLSLIIYALLIVISIKYIAIVMRADNQGEGGILALTALLPAAASADSGSRWPTAARRCSASSARRCSTATA